VDRTLLVTGSSVEVCVDWQQCLHAEGERTEDSSCPLGHVRSVCTSIERVAGSVGPLLEPATAAPEPATAAAVRPPGADLSSLSALAILRALMNEMPISAFTS